MNNTLRNTLICTVGTSLLYPNLFGLPGDASSYPAWLKRQPPADQPHLTEEWVLALSTAFAQQDELKTAEMLTQLPGSTRLCGAEINSITDLIAREYCEKYSTLCFCHSDTEKGLQVAKILQHYYELQNYPVKLYSITDLQDQDPKRFRTKGLRNLTKKPS